MNNPLHILVSNDDGIHAPGIAALVEVAMEFGEVTVVAPDSPQSGMGHAISIGKPLRLTKEKLPFDVQAFAASGTPADCVKLATGVLMDKTPDLILSGINHGYNSSVSSIYSGTLSAAREGAIQSVPSVGFSLGNFQHGADMNPSKAVVRAILKEVTTNKLKAGQLLNVNIPYLPEDEIKGIKVVRQAMGRWVEEFDERVDPYGRKYYWLTGNFDLQDEGTDTDVHALTEGYVSVTPMTHDLTALSEIADLSKLDFKL
ncbi:MAG: 5'/3'-nucleotidase SurE [Bacteroidia bacterium]|nr:5'/3'-nucleotidase SurE [Bacteroidia bacterium]